MTKVTTSSAISLLDECGSDLSTPIVTSFPGGELIFVLENDYQKIKGEVQWQRDSIQ